MKYCHIFLSVEIAVGYMLQEAEKYLPDEKKLQYTSALIAKLAMEDLKGCGHSGEVDIRKGEGKLAWKVRVCSKMAGS